MKNENKIIKGQYYTPYEYVKLSQEMLLNRINYLKSINKDFIIIDRFCGLGQLFEGLSEEILKKCYLSTIDYEEYDYLNKIKDKKFNLIKGPKDSLSYKIIDKEIEEKINDPNCAIILYENPPYSEPGGLLRKNVSNSTIYWKNSFVYNEMKKEYKGVITNDVCNLAIWSGFNYYLTKPFDSYILYAPIKYFKNTNLVNKNIIDSFICNKKYFTGFEGALTCINYSNIINNRESFKSKIYDIKDNKAYYIKDIWINKVYKSFTDIKDKRVFNDSLDGIICDSNGFETKRTVVRAKPYDNDNIIGYIKGCGAALSHNAYGLSTRPNFNNHGFIIRKDNYINYLPCFCANIAYNYFKWYQINLVYKTADYFNDYIKNKKLLLKCFLYTCLSYKNKCLSLYGSNGKLYLNNLCFDKGSKAYEDLKLFSCDLDKNDKKVLDKYYELLFLIKNHKNYNKELTYGPYQIDIELNTDKNDKLAKLIKENKKLIKEYFISEVFPLLFENKILI